MNHAAPLTRMMLAGALAALLAADCAGAVEAPPFAGCWERVYDAAHLAAHKDQLVVRVTLSVTAHALESAQPQTGPASPTIADAALKMWVRGHRMSFDSLGACDAAGDALSCGGSLSAAETDTCRSKRDGVRACRVDPADAGAFRIERRPDGVVVSVDPRLELVPAPYDGPVFLSLSAANREHRAFLLKPAPGACK